LIIIYSVIGCKYQIPRFISALIIVDIFCTKFSYLGNIFVSKCACDMMEHCGLVGQKQKDALCWVERERERERETQR